MKFKQYINEVKVKQTDADVFLDEYAPIFMWSPKSGLLWSRYEKDIDEWRVYKGSKKIPRNKKFKGGKFFTHEILVRAFRIGHEEDYIRGRISPDGKTIYVHNDSREYSEKMGIHYEKYVDKAVDAIYTYMGKYIK